MSINTIQELAMRLNCQPYALRALAARNGNRDDDDLRYVQTASGEPLDEEQLDHAADWVLRLIRDEVGDSGDLELASCLREIGCDEDLIEYLDRDNVSV